MLGPYRDPVLVDADPLPNACVPEGAGAGCPRCSPAAAPPAPWVSPGFAKALSAAATLLLLIGSASVAATTWTVVSTVLAARQQHLGADAPPTLGRGASPLPALATFGAETHDVEALWTRAQQLVAARSSLTLARATLAPGVVADAGDLAGRLHEKSRRGHGGLRLFALDARSPAALVGLRTGDLVTAINGFALRRPEDAEIAQGQLAAAKGAVVELVRKGRPVALRVDWGS